MTVITAPKRRSRSNPEISVSRRNRSMAAVREDDHETVGAKSSANVDTAVNRRSSAALSGSAAYGLAEHEQLTEGNRVLRRGLPASPVVNVGLITLVVFFATLPRAIPY